MIATFVSYFLMIFSPDMILTSLISRSARSIRNSRRFSKSPSPSAATPLPTSTALACSDSWTIEMMSKLETATESRSIGNQVFR